MAIRIETIATEDVRAEFTKPATNVVRWVDIYEADNVTLWRGNVAVTEGQVTVDMNRDDRRNIDITLLDDGTLGYGPGNLWYDKIIKPYRGLQLGPTFIPGSVSLPGAIGNYVYLSRAPRSSLTHLEFAVRASFSGLNTDNGLAGWNGASTGFNLIGDGSLNIWATSTTGAMIGGAVSNATIDLGAFAPDQIVWLRGKLTISTAVCQYWWSQDQTNDFDDVDWTQLGTNVTGTNAGATPRLTNSGVIYFGTTAAEVAGFEGGLYGGYEALNNATTIEFDVSGIPAGQTTFQGISGGTVTVVSTVNQDTWDAGDADDIGVTIEDAGDVDDVDVGSSVPTVTENFNKADGTLGPNLTWTRVAGTGTINVVSNRAQLTTAAGASAHYIQTTGPMANPDVQVTADFSWDGTAGSFVGLILRSYGSTDLRRYLLQVKTTQVDIVRYDVAGAATTIATQVITVTSGAHTIMFRAIGTQLTGYVDGTQVVTVTDSTFAGGQYTGIRQVQNGAVGSVWMDNFAVQPVDLSSGGVPVADAGGALEITGSLIGSYITGPTTEEGDIWVTPLGEFMPDKIDRPHFPKSLHITGRDFTKKCLLDKFPATTSFAVGANVGSTINSIATNAGITKFNFAPVTNTLPAVVTFEKGTERWKAMKDLADSIAHEIFFDASGNLTLRPFVDPLLAPLTYTFMTGGGGNLISYTRSTSDVRMFNHVAVNGNGPTNGLVHGEAENNNISSPTRIALIGRRTNPVESALVADNTAAVALATAYLKVQGLEQYDFQMEAVVIPWIEAGNAVEVQVSDAEASDPTRYLFTDFTIPLSLSTMSGTARRVTIVG